MAQTINTNLVSLNAQRNLSASQGALATSMQRLSSGLRVNSAKDDAAGLAIAERMNAQVRGMNVAMRNANDAISLSQTAEGALGKVGDLFQRMRELAVQSANGTNSDTDRLSLNEEYVQLAQEATRTLGGTQFNGRNILASADANVFQIGANNDTDLDRISVDGFDWTAATDITNVLATPCSPAPAPDDGDHRHRHLAGRHRRHRHRDQRGEQRARQLRCIQNRFENVVSNLMMASRTSPLHAAASWTPTTPWRRPTCRAPASCSRPATPWWRRPTSCPSRCSRCCAEPQRPAGPAAQAAAPRSPSPPPGGLFRGRRTAANWAAIPALFTRLPGAARP
jgi:flagellin